MSGLEDLRGRSFELRESAGPPPTFSLLEEPIEIGRIVRVPDLRPTFFADFVERRWRIEHSVGVLGPSLDLRLGESDEPLAKTCYTSAAEMRLVLAERTYSLQRLSETIAGWHDGYESVVTFRPTTDRLSVTGFVLTGANVEDAPPLLLLGFVMAIENTLFR